MATTKHTGWFQVLSKSLVQCLSESRGAHGVGDLAPGRSGRLQLAEQLTVSSDMR